MKRRACKILSILLCLCMLSGLTACGAAPVATTTTAAAGDGAEAPTTAATTTTAADAAPTTAASTTAVPTPAEPVNLSFWHIWGSGDANSEAVAQVIADWNAANPNIQVTAETFENQAYKTTIRTNVSGDTAPDIYSVWGGGFSKPFVDAGKVLELNQYLNDGTLEKLNPGALDFFTYNNEVYGMTFGKAASGFFCNARVFEENNVKLPETWEELLTAIDTFNAAGVTPIVTTSKEAWVIGMLFEGLALKAVGSQKTIDTLLKQGDGTFSDPQFLNAANKLMELVDKGAFNSDMAAITRDEALAAMKAGEGAMYYMGAWEAQSFEAEDSPDRGNYEWVPFPTLPDGNGVATDFNGGMIDGVMINSKTAYPAEAAAFVKYFCENLSTLGFAAGSYMPAWNTSTVDESALPPVFAKINDYTNAATNYVIWWDTGLVGDDVTTYQTALDSYVNKLISAEELIAELQKITP